MKDRDVFVDRLTAGVCAVATLVSVALAAVVGISGELSVIAVGWLFLLAIFTFQCWRDTDCTINRVSFGIATVVSASLGVLHYVSGGGFVAGVVIWLLLCALATGASGALALTGNYRKK